MSNFLPAPTLVAPESVPRNLLVYAGVYTRVQAAPAPPPASGPPNPPANQEVAAESELARLIDRGIVLASYAWMCCGSGLLAVAAVGMAALIRRTTPR